MLSPFEELRKELNRVLGLEIKSGPSIRVAKEFVAELKLMPSNACDAYGDFRDQTMRVGGARE